MHSSPAMILYVLVMSHQILIKVGQMPTLSVIAKFCFSSTGDEKNFFDYWYLSVSKKHVNNRADQKYQIKGILNITC